MTGKKNENKENAQSKEGGITLWPKGKWNYSDWLINIL